METEEVKPMKPIMKTEVAMQFALKVVDEIYRDYFGGRSDNPIATRRAIEVAYLRGLSDGVLVLDAKITDALKKPIR